MKKILPLFLLCGCVSVNNSFNFNTQEDIHYIETARVLVGLDENSNRKELKNFLGVDPVRYEWCAAFVNGVLNFHGIKGSEGVSNYPLTARSFIHWGQQVSEPQLGDIVVFPRGNQSWQGHVGFYIKSRMKNGKLHYVILGGNQDDSINYQLFPADTAISIRRADIVN